VYALGEEGAAAAIEERFNASWGNAEILKPCYCLGVRT